MPVSTRFSFRNIVLVGILFPFLLAGCGGGGSGFHAATPSSPGVASQNSATPPAPPSPPAPTPTPTPPPNPAPTPTPPPNPGLPQHGPVVLLVEENHGFSSVIGSSAMPYLNSLAKQNSLAIQYYANTHPSIGNYFMMTAGQIVTNDDTFNGPVNVDNLVRHLMQAGKTWKSYSESLPSIGYIGGDSGAYIHRHNPLSYFQDVVGSSNERQNLVPFGQFAADLNNGQLPDFSFVTPNANDDAHNGTLQQADQWLQSNIAPLLSNPQFQKGGLLLIVFDEAEDTDSTLGGGRVAMIAVGPLVKHGFQSSTQYQHQNLLRMITDYLGMDGNIGSAGGANGMGDLLQ
jgi:acid phosphatase